MALHSGIVFRKVVASVLVAAMIGLGFTQAAGPAFAQVPSSSGQAQAMERLDRFYALLLELRSHLDRSQFDLDALLEKLDYDVDEVIRFVTEEIHFEQYPGLLRGAQGTLMTRAGNALDQAVLLATLLKKAGLDARIARATLGNEQAKLLIRQMAVERRPAPLVGDLAAIRGVLRRILDLVGAAEGAEMLLESVGAPPALLSTELHARAVADREWLLAELREAGVRVGDPGWLERITSEARDYFWVEHRAGPASAWNSAHPAFGREAREQVVSVEPARRLTEEIPAELQHRFRFDVVLERRVGDRTEEVPILSAWERPVANLIGEPVTYTNIPDTWLRQGLDREELDDALDRADLFLPIFNVEQRGEEAFDLSGMTVPIDAAATAAAGALRTASKKLSQAGAAIGALGREADAAAARRPEMTALLQQRLEFTLIAPGGQEERHVREVLPEAESSSGDAMRRQLAMTHTFMLAPGNYPRAYVINRAIEKHLNNRPLVEIELRKALEPGSPIAVSAQVLSAVDLRSFEHLQLYPLFDAGAAGGDQTYRPVASLVVVSRELPADGSTMGIVDIVRNRRRAFAVSGGDVTPSFETSVASGTWESYAEELILGPGQESFSAARSVRAARDASLEIVTLQPHQSAEVEDLALSRAAKTNLLADLASGFVVAVPRRPPPGFQGRVGWWRVDPLSGETLAVGDDGRGVVLTETETFLLGWVLPRLLIFGPIFGMIIHAAISQAVERVIDCVAFDLSHGHRRRGVVETTASRCLSSGSTR